MNTIQLTKTQLQSIINKIDEYNKNDNSMSETIEIEIKENKNTHLGGDLIRVYLKSVYSECNSQLIY